MVHHNMVQFCLDLCLRRIPVYLYIGLTKEPLKLTSGVIWTALNIDYPGHSFSHLGVFFGPLT